MLDLYRMQKGKLLGLLAPVLFIAGAIILTGFVDESPERTAEITRGVFGPADWPTYMLYGVAFFAVAWLLQRLVTAYLEAKAIRLGRVDAQARAAVQPSAGAAVEARVLIAIGVIGAYGYFIPIIGFAFATLAFFLIWFVLGGIKKPQLIGIVSVLGTLFMLYLFVKLAGMPLSRGEGVFSEWTVALYQFLKVF